MRHYSKVSDHSWARLHAIEAMTEQDTQCAYCKRPITRATATADHVRAVSNGGSTRRDNIKAACGPCNRAKGAMTEKQFKASLRLPMPPHPMALALAWVRFRIWRRANKACQTIERLAR